MLLSLTSIFIFHEFSWTTQFPNSYLEIANRLVEGNNHLHDIIDWYGTVIDTLNS